MKPNRLALAYLIATCSVLAAAALLASAAAAARLLTAAVGWPGALGESWLLRLSIVGLGVLPWPGLLVLARALLRPARNVGGRVRDAAPGPATVAVIALNEEEAIERVVADFAATPGVAGILVIDNRSTDQTARLAVAAGAEVISEHRPGYGRACMRALAEAAARGHPTVVLCEGDHTFRASDVDKLAAYLRHADLVLGSRTHGPLISGDSQLNSFFVLGNVFVAKLLQLRYWDWRTGGRVRLSDVGCTYLAVRAEALRAMLPALQVEGNHFLPHLIMVALEHGLEVVQIPITFWKRLGRSKGGNASWGKGFRLGLVMIWHILTYRVRRVRASAEEALEHAVSS